MLEKHRESLKEQREAVKHRIKKLAARQSEITVSLFPDVFVKTYLKTCILSVVISSITKKVHLSDVFLTQKQSSAIKDSIIQKYQEIQVILEEDLRTTLSHLEVEERAAVSALDGLMDRNCSLIQEIEQDLARLSLALSQTDALPNTTVGEFRIQRNKM